jgi:DegV family protein with EDD domain
MNMSPKIGLIADEASDLPESFRKEYRIGNVIYPVRFPSDDEDTPLRGMDFYRAMLAKGEVPTTSFPPEIRFAEAYRRSLESFDQVLAITISSKMSGAHHHARAAVGMLESRDQGRIKVLDSWSATVGEGLMAFLAQMMIERGFSAEEIEEKVSSMAAEVKLFGFLRSVRWLIKGGRLSGSKAKLAFALEAVGAKYVIGILDGKVDFAGLRIFSDRTSAIFRELEKAAKIRPIEVAIAHAGSLKEAEIIASGVRSDKRMRLAFVSEISPVIAAHAGPGIIGAAYLNQDLA